MLCCLQGQWRRWWRRSSSEWELISCPALYGRAVEVRVSGELDQFVWAGVGGVGFELN